jgi:EmrB/QacA subfamily drug resistance transporter
VSELEVTEPAREDRRAAPTTIAKLFASRWAGLAVLMAGTFVLVLDFFIVNVAIPSIQRDLHAGATEIEWIVAGYGLSFAVTLITAGRLGDRFGRRRMLRVGFALFAATSALCGAAPNASVLIAARVVQGFGAALLSANILSIIGLTYNGRDRIRAISVYGMVMGLAAVGGQLIGGGLISANLAGLGWRWVFLINIPVAGAALALAPRLVNESRADHRVRIDAIGATLLTTGLLTLVLPLIEGQRYGWPPWTWASLAAAPIGLGLFALYERRLTLSGRTPLLDLTLFKERTFSAGLATQLALWCGQASFFLVLALYLQNGRGLSPLRSGLVFAILAAAYLAASLQAPALTVRHGRRIVAIGALTLALGHAGLLLAVDRIGTDGSVAALVPGLLLVGAGMGLCITPLTTTVLASVDPHRAGAVSGTLSTMQQLGSSLGVAVTGVIFFGTLHRRGIAYAFELSVSELAALLLAVAALSRLLPPNEDHRC